MALSAVFAQTSRITEAVELMNGISNKFPVLLSKILQNLHASERIFTPDEEERLQELFDMAPGDLRTVLDACAYVFERAAFHALAGDALAVHLEGLGLRDEQAAAFSRAWDTKGSLFVERLRSKTLAPLLLDGVDWRLHVHLAQANLGGQQDLRALLALRLRDGSDASAAGDTLTMELDQAGLEACTISWRSSRTSST